MYKCCDCGCEYQVKPDFCDCGNDVFEEIIVEKSAQKIVQEPTVKLKKTFSEQYPGLSGFMATLDPISVIIFALCIVLSICSFIFIKPNENVAQEKPKEEQKIERKVADINTFWNDAPPKRESKNNTIEISSAEDIVNQIINILPKTEEVKPAENKTVQKTQTVTQTQNNKTQTQIKPASKNQSVQKTQTTQKTTKPVSKTQPKTTQSKQTVNKTTQNQQQNKTNTVVQKKPVQQQKTTTTQTNTPTQQTQQTQQTTSQTQIQVKPVNTTISIQQAEQDLKNFKKGIQSLFASNIKGNLLQVYGDGSCVVDFKVDSRGKFVNRSFSKQSTNNTLNDAVYQAVMATPSYKSPPAAYKGQTLHLSVKIINGMAQISVY